MPLLEKLERRFRRFAVPHLTIGLILCQVLVYAMAQGQILKAGNGDLQDETAIDRIARCRKCVGRPVWRLPTFVCDPPTTNAVFARWSFGTCSF